MMNDAEQQREHLLCHLSEKLSTVLGLSYTPAETAIGIIRRLGLYGDGLTRDFTFEERG